MASLVSRELKFFFTSPLFISLELIPIILITILDIAGSNLKGPLQYVIPSNLLSIIWLMIVFCYTYFELEMWRKRFLNKGVKLKIYTSRSAYAPFLGHSLVSLVLLELKTLIFLPSFLMPLPQFENIVFFLIATHVNWLFSISIGGIFSREVFNKLAESTAMFLCMLIFGMIGILIVNSYIDQQPLGGNQTRTNSTVILTLKDFWPHPLPDSSLPSQGLNYSGVLLLLPLFSILYAVALYANSKIVENIHIDDV